MSVTGYLGNCCKILLNKKVRKGKKRRKRKEEEERGGIKSQGRSLMSTWKITGTEDLKWERQEESSLEP